MKEYGGFWCVILLLLLEVFFFVLLVLVCMLFYMVFVVSVFFGWEVVWNLLQCDDDFIFWGEVFKCYGL